MIQVKNLNYLLLLSRWLRYLMRCTILFIVVQCHILMAESMRNRDLCQFIDRSTMVTHLHQHLTVAMLCTFQVIHFGLKYDHFQILSGNAFFPPKKKNRGSETKMCSTQKKSSESDMSELSYSIVHQPPNPVANRHLRAQHL